MPQLTPSAWIIWILEAAAQAGLLAYMLGTGAWRRWSSLAFFLFVLTLRDACAFFHVLVTGSPAGYFYSFWWTSALACVAEVWLMVQIALELGGVTRKIRRIICASIPACSIALLLVLIRMCFEASVPHWGRVAYIVAAFDEAVSLAWLCVFLLMAVISDGVFGIQWSRVKGVALGFAIELSAASLESWMAALNIHLRLASEGKGAIYVLSLCIWMVSVRPPSLYLAGSQPHDSSLKICVSGV